MLTDQFNDVVDGGFDEDHIEQAIINPGLEFRVTHYFVDHWLPILKPTHASLVVVLQQTCWKGRVMGNSGRIAQAEMGRLCGLNRTNTSRLIANVKREIEGDSSSGEAGYLSWFIRDIQTVFDANRNKQAPHRYTMLLNDPLTPAMTTGLQQILIALRSETEDMAAALDYLIQMDRQALLERLNEAGRNNPATSPRTVTAIVSAVFGEADQARIQQLSHHILRPDQVYLGTHYFLKQWVPLIGPELGWVITVIRRHCYDDGVEVRDGFLFEKAELADKIGVHIKTLKRHLLTSTGNGNYDLVEKIHPFFPAREVTRYHISGRILVKQEPLTEDGLRQKALMVNSQSNLFGLTNDGPDGNGQKSTPSPDKKAHLERTKKHTLLDGNGQKSTPSPDKKAHSSAPISTLKESAPDQHHQHHQHQGGNFVNDGGGAVVVGSDNVLTGNQAQTLNTVTTHPDPTPSHIKTALAALRINEPKLGQLAQRPHVAQPGYLDAWTTWYADQTEFKPGWVILQLEAGLWPPSPADRAGPDQGQSPTGEPASLPAALSPAVSGGPSPGYPPDPDDNIVTFDGLSAITLAPNQVLTPLDDDHWRVEDDIEAVVKAGIRAAGGYDAWRIRDWDDVYFSVSHALGEGTEEWSDEEEKRIGLMSMAGDKWGPIFDRIGGFDVQEALEGYFGPALARTFIANAGESELRRIEAWIAYTRRTKSIKSPPGFLRRKIESGEFCNNRQMVSEPFKGD